MDYSIVFIVNINWEKLEVLFNEKKSNKVYVLFLTSWAVVAINTCFEVCQLLFLGG